MGNHDEIMILYGLNFFFSEPAEPEENYDDFSEVIEQEHFFKFTFQSVCVCACV